MQKHGQMKQKSWDNMGQSRGGGGGGGGRGGRVSGLPLKNNKNIGFLSNTGLDPLKNLKATKPAYNFGPA